MNTVDVPDPKTIPAPRRKEASIFERIDLLRPARGAVVPLSGDAENTSAVKLPFRTLTLGFPTRAKKEADGGTPTLRKSFFQGRHRRERAIDIGWDKKKDIQRCKLLDSLDKHFHALESAPCGRGEVSRKTL